MNNNNINFDPFTGQPINRENNQTIPNANQTSVNNEQNQPTVEINTQVDNQNIQNVLQSIPTIEQTKQEFINNAQSLNTEQKKEKKQGINYAFVIILFIIVLAAIFFLFPMLMKYI